MSVFLGPLKAKPEKFALTEFGDDAFVFIRPLSSRELLELQDKHGDEGKGFDFNCEFLAKVLCHENGQALFGSPEECKDHVSRLPLPGLDRLIRGALDVSGVSHYEEKKS